MLEPALGVQAQLQDEGEGPAGDGKAQVLPLQQLLAPLGLDPAEQGKPGELQKSGQDGLSLRRIDGGSRRGRVPNLDGQVAGRLVRDVRRTSLARGAGDHRALAPAGR